MIRKKLVAGALILAMTVALGGCGGTTKKEDSKDTPVATEANGAAGGLKDAFADDFTVGVAINTYQLTDSDKLEIIQKDFNSITMENEMKPENILDQAGSEGQSDGMPRIKTDNLESILKLAKDNGFKLRGHTLVWHSQTPDWFFRKDYEASNDYVDKDTMSKRMESYIKQVLTFCQEKYPGVVYAWDVVNEAMGDGGGFRTEGSGWYDIFGEEFIEKAFTYARKYADKDVKLFYNDYNSYEASKRNMIFATVSKLKEKNLIDGIGMQSHWDMEYPSVDNIETAIEKFSEIKGIEIQLTEIDMHNTDDSDEGLKAQAARYKEIFTMLKNMDKKGANITNVTFWGLQDDVTWLSSFKGEESFPLLFDADGKAKPVYNSLMEVAKAK